MPERSAMQGAINVCTKVLSKCEIFVQSNIIVHKGAIAADITFVHDVRLNLRQSWHIELLCPNDLQCKEQF